MKPRKAPGKSRRWRRKPAAPPGRRRLRRGSKGAAPRIWRRRSRRSHRSPKRSSSAMAERARARGPAAAPAPQGIAAGETQSSAASEHLVVFQLARGSFGLRLGGVGEIIRLPGLTRMPLAPTSLMGLANLRGAVLPVLSLRRLLGLPDALANEATRVIVLDGDAPVGFVVDQVDRLLTLPAAQIEHDDAGAGELDPELLDGAVRGAEGESTTKILNPQRLLRDQFVRLAGSGARP